MKALKSYLEAVIYFKDGTKDWVSPIEDTEENIYIDDNIISIDNGYLEYDYSIDKIDYVEVVNLLEDEVIDSEIIFKNGSKITTIKQTEGTARGNLSKFM